MTTFSPYDIDLNTDSGRSKAFRHGAQDCLSCARRLADASAGEYILTLHALELALKAFLAQQGLSNKKLRNKPFRHNLVNLYEKACERGLSISDQHASILIEYVNRYHDEGAPIRYDFTQAYELPVAKVLFPLITEVIEASRSLSKADSYPRLLPPVPVKVLSAMVAFFTIGAAWIQLWDNTWKIAIDPVRSQVYSAKMIS